MIPKILIGVGTCDKFSYCEDSVFNAILNQTNSDFELLIVDNSKEINYFAKLMSKFPTAKIKHLNRPKYFRDAVGQVRKYITDYAVFNGYDYLLFIDADFIIEPNTLKKLLSHNLDFVSAVIGYLHQKDNYTTLYVEDILSGRVSKIPGLPPIKPILYSELDTSPNIREITCSGLSCCLIKVRHLIGINFYVSHEQQAFLEDFIFCRDLKRKGIKLFADFTLRPMHLHVMMLERNNRAGF